MSQAQFPSRPLKKEIKKAKRQFTRIVEAESKRVRDYAAKENERIMQEMRADGTLQSCPICLDEIPAIHDFLKKGSYMICCNVMLCKDCQYKSVKFIFRESKCFNCREPIRPTSYWANSLTPNDKRHWIMHAVANEYVDGAQTLPKDVNKAVKLFTRAAELGDVDAEDQLAKLAFTENIYPNNFYEKATYYSKKGVARGLPNSQYIQAYFNENVEENYRLYTLSAFQGTPHARLSLGDHYIKKLTPRSDEEERKKLIFLAVYWYGKAAEVEFKSSRGSDSLGKFATHLDAAIRLFWHPREKGVRDTLPGCSHVPLCTWALSNRLKHPVYDSYTDTNTFIYSLISPLALQSWKGVCANCKKLSQTEGKFKACARCKAFHYCSKKCQVEHWKNGHKVDCNKAHWIEEFFPELRLAYG